MGKPLKAWELLRAERECCTMLSAAAYSWSSIEDQFGAVDEAIAGKGRDAVGELVPLGPSENTSGDDPSPRGPT